MKLGLQLGYWGAQPPANHAELVAAAEASGFDSVFTAEAWGSDAYTPLAWCYKVFVTLSIIAFIANQYFVVGVILALWSAIGLFVIPLWKAWKHVASAPSLHRRRRQAIQISLALIAALALGLGLIPLPLRTQAQGVIWLPEQALVRSQTEGFFVRWVAEPGRVVLLPRKEFARRQAAWGDAVGVLADYEVVGRSYVIVGRTR